MFLRERRERRKRRMFLTEKEEKKEASHREASRKISGEFDDKDTSDSECKARMTQITSSIFNFQFAIFPRCR